MAPATSGTAGTAGRAGRGRRARILAALEAHGLSPAGAVALRQVGVALRDRMLRTKLEYGAVVDAETGEPFGGVLTGSGDAVDAGPLLRALRPGRRYAGVHTHPEGASFSSTDALVLVTYAPVLRAVAAVGAQGTWYLLSLASLGLERPPLPAADLFAAFVRERDALTPAYQALLRAGDLTRREAQRAHTHAIWERLAPALGLRYDRVEREA